MTNKSNNKLIAGASAIFGMSAFALVVSLGAIPVSAFSASGDASNPATSNQVVEIGSDSLITISSSVNAPASISAAANTAGGFGVAPPVDIAVSSNDARGYNLTISMIGTDTHSGALWDQINGSNTAVVAGIPAAGTLSANQWGYTVVQGTTNTIPTIASSFLKVPAATSAASLIGGPTGAAGTSNVIVNYGAMVDYTLPSGSTYSNTVTYTASITTP